ncbi:hypothetical protein G7075_08250 [Phycicoccus sp. HDW14]|uniref:hypothetical protein n=1 Tax=Phycicoccus sp. HDW14 TaxID=2714941 RepID=UPI00140A9880|nr:hypothetical protein [Phycicoccus sp. HDW14]QIM21120.1 hypothetical protein G7075_08250 [Phycicoccus sp. HDW14]
MTTDPAPPTTSTSPVHDLVQHLLAEVSAIPDPVDREAAALHLSRELADGSGAASALARLVAHSRQRPRAYVDEEDGAPFARPPWA